MTVTLSLPKDIEEPLRREAEQKRLPIEEVAEHRLWEAELLRRIFAYFPPEETRQMRQLVRKRQEGTLSETESQQLTELAHRRETKNADRLADLLALSRLRGVPLRRLMLELGIRPSRVA